MPKEYLSTNVIKTGPLYLLSRAISFRWRWRKKRYLWKKREKIFFSIPQQSSGKYTRQIFIVLPAAIKWNSSGQKKYHGIFFSFILISQCTHGYFHRTGHTTSINYEQFTIIMNRLSTWKTNFIFLLFCFEFGH